MQRAGHGGVATMYLVTGGAGFIGSNLRRRTRRARAEVDGRGPPGRAARSGATWPGIRSPASCRRGNRGFLGRRRRGGRGAPSRRDQRDHRDRRRPGGGDQLHAASCGSGAPAREREAPLIYASSAATYGDGSARLRRRRLAGGAGAAAPAEPLRLVKHAFDRRVGRARGAARPRPPQWAGLNSSTSTARTSTTRAAWSRVVPQVQAGEVAGGAPAPLFRSDRPGIADGEQTARLRLCRRLRRGHALAARQSRRERAVQRGHRPGPQLPRPGRARLRRARARPRRHRVRRHAGRSARASTSTSPKRRWTGCARRATQRQITPLEDGIRRYVQDFLDAARPVPLMLSRPPSPHRPGPDPGRAVRHPLVRAGLYRRHPARLALVRRLARAAAGRRHAASSRRLPHLGDARRHPRRPARLRAVLPARLLPPPPAGDLRRLAGRHVLPWRRARRDRSRSSLFCRQRADRAAALGDRSRRWCRSAWASAGSPTSSTASCGAGVDRRALGHGLPARRRRSRATRASSTRRCSRARAVHRAVRAGRSAALRARRGFLTGVFLVGYGVARIIGELFRQPDAFLGFLFAGATMGQLLSLPMVLVGALADPGRRARPGDPAWRPARAGASAETARRRRFMARAAIASPTTRRATRSAGRRLHHRARDQPGLRRAASGSGRRSSWESMGQPDRRCCWPSSAPAAAR